MAPSFLKDLRRRSRASIRTERSTDRSGETYHTDSSSNASQGTVPTTGSLTPPSNHGSDPALHMQLKQPSSQSVNSVSIRPPLQPVPASNRYSVSGMTGLGSPAANGKSKLPVSPYAPRIVNCADGSSAYQKVLIVRGTIGDPSQHTIDGCVHVSRLDNQCPETSWRVCDSHWKALVYLQPGLNRLRFDFTSPRISECSSSNRIHSSFLDLFMVPPQNAPPLQLAILLAKDSPETFDAVPARVKAEGNGLETAKRKYRMAAYLWQAFTAEQMSRHRMGRRSFVFEEEWGTGTSHSLDPQCCTMRSEARIHVIRMDKTIDELRDLSLASGQSGSDEAPGLFSAAADAVRKYFRPLPGQKQYVSAMLLDSHWEKESGVVKGHTGYGGSCGDLNLALFGSHCLQSYPSMLDEVTSAFEDCTRTDTAYVANLRNEAGSSWEAANAGIGGHLQEIGRMFGCPRQEGGVMSQEVLTISRSFISREPSSTRTRSKGGLVNAMDECSWHTLDCLRFRWHPCFRLPNDQYCTVDDSIQVYPVEGGEVILAAKTGVSHVEVMGETDDFCRAWITCGTERGLPKQTSVTEQDVRGRLQEGKRKGRIQLSIFSGGGGHLKVDDFGRLFTKETSFKLTPGPVGKQAYRGRQLGHRNAEGREAEEVVFESAHKQNRVLVRVVIYHDPNAVHGIEFVYDDNSSHILGNKDGIEGRDAFDLDLRRGEYIAGFSVRSGDWIHGISILTSLGYSTPTYGNAHGGSLNSLLPPRGYTICGVSGCSRARLESFGLLVTH